MSPFSNWNAFHFTWCQDAISLVDSHVGIPRTKCNANFWETCTAPMNWKIFSRRVSTLSAGARSASKWSRAFQGPARSSARSSKKAPKQALHQLFLAQEVPVDHLKIRERVSTIHRWRLTCDVDRSVNRDLWRSSPIHHFYLIMGWSLAGHVIGVPDFDRRMSRISLFYLSWYFSYTDRPFF